VHFEFPSIGKVLKTEDPALTIESVKTAADVLSPVAGKIKACNTELETNPTLVNEKAEDTWIVEIECDHEP
jgi:glycine cleavage system H protein